MLFWKGNKKRVDKRFGGRERREEEKIYANKSTDELNMTIVFYLFTCQVFLECYIKKATKPFCHIFETLVKIATAAIIIGITLSSCYSHIILKKLQYSYDMLAWKSSLKYNPLLFLPQQLVFATLFSFSNTMSKESNNLSDIKSNEK